MPYFPRDWDAPERRAKLRAWLKTLQGPARTPKPDMSALHAIYEAQARDMGNHVNLNIWPQQWPSWERQPDMPWWTGIINALNNSR